MPNTIVVEYQRVCVYAGMCECARSYGLAVRLDIHVLSYVYEWVPS